MKLPNSFHAYIPEAKLREYLLSPTHPEGGPKSVFFHAMGYTEDNILELETALLVIAMNGEVTDHYEFEFGRKYVVEGNLRRVGGTQIPLRTVWVIDSGEQAPRFITAYPL